MQGKDFNSYDYYNIIVPDLKNIKNTLVALDKQISRINKEEDVPTIKSRIYVLINDMEKLALKGRSIPLYAERENYDVDTLVMNGFEIERKGTVIEMVVPLLLPKVRSNKANKSYLVGMFHNAFKNFFNAQDKTRYEEPVIIWFEYQYKKRTGRQGFRDHDNVETKIVKDLLVPYVVHDDCPLYCDDFHTSKIGENDATLIHIVPRRMFAEYYKERREMDG